MKIGIVGCGALGSYYGAKLARAGEETHFLLRSDYPIVRRFGLRIESPEGNFHVQPKCARSPEEIGPCDLVLIGLKTTANHAFPALLPPLVADHTTVLTLQNGLGNEAELARLFGDDRIMGGLCFVCLNRIRPGLVQHLAHGRIVLGEYRRWPEPRTHDIATVFRRAGIPCKVTDNLERAHWEKLVWNIPFNGLGVASAAGYDSVLAGRALAPLNAPLTTDRLLNDPRWRELVRELMSEIIAAANERGLKVSAGLIDDQIAKTEVMGVYKPSTLVDFERGQALELESLFLAPLKLAKQTGAPVPRLTALCALLTELESNRMRNAETL